MPVNVMNSLGVALIANDVEIWVTGRYSQVKKETKRLNDGFRTRHFLVQ